MASRRNLCSFAILGMLNNVVFVLSNASAGNLLPNAIGLVFVVNTAPGLLVKLLAPLWIDKGSYNIKICLIGCCLAFNLAMILTDTPVWLKLVGVAIGVLGSGAGEASCMAMSQFYVQPQRHISFFSVGTGLAGVIGFALKIWVLPAISNAMSLVVGMVLVLTYWFTFYIVMDAPWADVLEGCDISAAEASYISMDDGLLHEEGSEVAASVSTAWHHNRRSASLQSMPFPSEIDGGSGVCTAWRLKNRSASLQSMRLPASESLLKFDPIPTLARMHSSSRELFGSCASSLDAFTSADEIRRSGYVARGREGAKAVGTRARMLIFRELLPFLGPLCAVFWAAYACQSGAWTAFALDDPTQLASKEARDRAFQYYNFMYQVGPDPRQMLCGSHTHRPSQPLPPYAQRSRSLRSSRWGCSSRAPRGSSLLFLGAS